MNMHGCWAQFQKMRGLLFIGLTLIASCSNRDTGDNAERLDDFRLTTIKFNTANLDSLTLKQLIINNDRLLDIFRIKLQDKEKTEKVNAILQSDSNRLRIYNSFKFKIKDDKRCKEYRHLLISREGNKNSYDLVPYKSLYLLIISPNDKVIQTEKLEEQSKSLAMIADETNWTLDQDSLLIINSRSTFCSDLIIEGEGTTCWTDKVQKHFKLECNGLELIKRDSTRTEKSE